MSRLLKNAILLIAITLTLWYVPMGMKLLVSFLNIKSKCELELVVDEKFKMNSHKKSNVRCPNRFLESRAMTSSVELLSIFLIVVGFGNIMMAVYTFRHLRTNVNSSLLRNYAVITSMIITSSWILVGNVYGSWRLKSDPRDSDHLNEYEKELFHFYHLMSMIFKFFFTASVISWFTLVPMGLSACNFAGIERVVGERVDGDGAEEVISLQNF